MSPLIVDDHHHIPEGHGPARYSHETGVVGSLGAVVHVLFHKIHRCQGVVGEGHAQNHQCLEEGVASQEEGQGRDFDCSHFESRAVVVGMNIGSTMHS